MSYFKPKMHQILFPLGVYIAPSDPLAGLNGPTSKGEQGKETWEWRSWEGREREGKG